MFSDQVRQVIALLFVVAASAQQPAPSAGAKSDDSLKYSLASLLDGTGFVRIPAGEFVMGSAVGNEDEKPPHRIRINHDFEMSRYEVTQAQWEAVLGRAHEAPKTTDPQVPVNPSEYRGPSLPVEKLTWNAAQSFIEALNTRDSGHTYRMPTEAEFEYAARAGSDSDAPVPEDSAWCAPGSKSRTHPVGEKPPNPWGLYDMTGNVLEWVQDWYAPDYYSESPAADPQGPSTGSYRVYRGAGWLTPAKNCRAAFRGFDLPSNGHASVGFRLVRTSKTTLP